MAPSGIALDSEGVWTDHQWSQDCARG